MNSDEGLQTWLNDKRCKRVWLGYSKEDWYYPTTPEGKNLSTVYPILLQILFIK